MNQAGLEYTTLGRAVPGNGGGNGENHDPSCVLFRSTNSTYVMLAKAVESTTTC